MRAYFQLLNQFPRLTIFSRPNCGLCSEAKLSISKALPKLTTGDKSLQVKEVDILEPENQKWFDKYAYDVPVVYFQLAEDAEIKRIMHHISETDIIKLVTA
ncbi:uncharacterized protein V1516DRAFT_538559 [Lipomyces oligophaga]|uniref:uncharacterized protein n=1 Tax=Lipomyces oligophaga TaxID=45792 RepID=UPI0034CDF5AE